MDFIYAIGKCPTAKECYFLADRTLQRLQPDAANYLCKGRSSFQSLLNMNATLPSFCVTRFLEKRPKKELSSAEILGTAAASGICVSSSWRETLEMSESKLIFGISPSRHPAFRT
ncbi:hypothetical protein CEXT_189251 [Caerostris extrusa]|uniref:Uncharacterized protein n=1 Tax=Caerostris extrusa TaxID=172846 RepID=A0AAV4MJX8_CAEEX|nr:hypothetical protein CEXT_189251 [Caerostris extrusa]